MKQKKYLFIDRDGTLIYEPEDKQIDSIEKFKLLSQVIPSLLKLQQAGFTLVMISNQDGLGTPNFPMTSFIAPQKLLLEILQSQGINFAEILICPHFANDGCNCRKPKIGLLSEYLIEQKIDRMRSYVIGDRATDIELANNLGVKGLLISQEDSTSWNKIIDEILHSNRQAFVIRKTNETDIKVEINLDHSNKIIIETGIGFFDHMLEQLAKHSGIGLTINVKGDLDIDEHHTVEDVAITLGQAFRQALGDKLGIQRFGFLLPMDEALAEIALDLCGRAFFQFQGTFNREKVGELATELVPHFFRSLSTSLEATLHMKVIGENSHHMIEALFKGLGKTLKQAINRSGHDLPSTKGVL